MRSLVMLIGSMMVSASTPAQQRILHFTHTSGFDHDTRAVSFAMFESIAAELGVEVVDDADASTFSDPSALALFDVIVFANTTGNAILDATQRSNFESFIANGGSVMGIHAATDTYRHSTANGSNTGTWDFYPELIGASVQENPNHVSGTPLYALEHINAHASTANLPDPWEKNEEYYYWLNGYYGPDNTEVLRVEETIGPNSQVNDYDAPRPMSWYRELPEGGRVFYTALGHAQENYTSDALFRTHVRDALIWLLEGTAGMTLPEVRSLNLFPNPCSATLILQGSKLQVGTTIIVLDATGRALLSSLVTRVPISLDLSGLAPGAYVLRIGEHYRSPVVVAR